VGAGEKRVEGRGRPVVLLLSLKPVHARRNRRPGLGYDCGLGFRVWWIGLRGIVQEEGKRGGSGRMKE
jgi:hypothetical protein